MVIRAHDEPFLAPAKGPTRVDLMGDLAPPKITCLSIGIPFYLYRSPVITLRVFFGRYDFIGLCPVRVNET